MTTISLLSSSKHTSPQQRYQISIANGQVSFDESQQQALMALQQLYEQQLHQKSSGLGLYLWGKVGRGKTFLMDSFAESFDKEVCLRQHFHHFMRDVHSQLTQLSGTKDPLRQIAKQLKKRHDILCFDEFFVTDIGDAMLLGRLIMYLFEQSMIVVATSNCAPDELYKDGLQRANFLPAIDAIHQNMKVVELAGIKDHRERQLHALKNYFVIDDNFKEASIVPDKNPGVIEILGREINYLAINSSAKNNNTIVFDFNDLCLGPRSHFDYIEIAKQFNTVYLLNVPALGGAMYERIKARGTEDGSIGSGATGEREVMLAPMDDGARRFIALIDELYDQRVALFLTCHVPLENLYTQGSLAFQFERARSRLIEMGSEEYNTLNRL
ncbi:MAG: cell division protein ZapE [Oleispira sp.]